MTDPASVGGGLAELVDLLEIAAVGATESALIGGGTCMPPTMHMISYLDMSPYIGYVITRPFTGGEDAHAAIAGMGALPAAARARRLVVVWEHGDLHAALEAPAAPPQKALIVLDADLVGHEVRWHPFSFGPRGRGASGRSPVAPLWGAPRRKQDVALPPPIADLLSTWRTGGDPRELRWLHHRMGTDGYTVHWMTSRARRTSQASSGMA